MADTLPNPRQSYWRFAQLQQWLTQLAADNADIVRVERYGSSAEGRPLYMVTVGQEPERVRPALWVDANMHSSELLGVQVAVSFINDLIALHRGTLTGHGLSSPVMQAAKAALVHVVPTLSPDGLEAVLDDGRFVRSSPVGPDNTRRPRWRQCDLDGDGQVRRMRVVDPCGAFVESKALPGLMLPRSVDDEGPFYALYPEGVIDDWDDTHVPPWGAFDDNPLDLNRNFSWGWRPEGEQEGAGDYAGSSPEARALMALATRLPHIMCWVNLHTFGGVWIRPLGSAPDSKLAFSDRAIFGLVEDWAQQHAGVPTVSGFEEFTYVPERPLCGDLSDFAWHQRGAYSWSVELWDIFARAGLPRMKRFVDRYADQRPADIEHLARALSAMGATSVLPWTPLSHPQLGDVEVGGFDPRFSVWNPPEGPLVDEVCGGHIAVFFRLLSLMPVLHVTSTREPLGDDSFLVTVTVENRGGLPTHGPQHGAGLPHSEGIFVEAVDGGGGDDAVVVSARVKGPRRQNIGHLGGTQLGRFGAGATWPYQNTEGLPARRRCTMVVQGAAPLTVRVGSVRTGFVEHAA